MAVVRSQYAHARVTGIDTAEAEEMDGVLAVHTDDDVDVPGEIPPVWLLPDLKTPPYPMLARERVRYQGQPIAVVVAEERYLAHDAADAINVDYERLEAVTGPRAALEADAPQLHEEAPGNVAAEWEIGDSEATDETFERADRTVSVDLVNQRLHASAMEPRATLAEYESSTDKATVHISTQCPHLHHRFFSEMLDLPEHRLRVVAPDVGGGFGSKDSTHPDEALTVWAATQLGRPVKRVADRTGGYSSTGHGRGHETTAEMAVTDDGDALAICVHTDGDLGAYLSTFGRSTRVGDMYPCSSGSTPSTRCTAR